MPAIIAPKRAGETVEIANLATVQDDILAARAGGFHQVPVYRHGTWGVLRRTPRSTDFIPTRSLHQAIAIVVSPVVC